MLGVSVFLLRPPLATKDKSVVPEGGGRLPCFPPIQIRVALLNGYCPELKTFSHRILQWSGAWPVNSICILWLGVFISCVVS